MSQKVSKAKYWTAVLYPESMIDNWEDNIADIVQVAYSYCIHDKDKDGHDGDRKTHIHVVLAFANTTTYKHVLSIFQKLQPTCSYCEQVLNIRYMYNYLIHDTDSCRKKGKHLYDASERVCGNNFDIGAYEQISITDKRKMAKELADFISDNCITNFIDFYDTFELKYGFEYFEVILTYSGFYERLCKGNYLKALKEINDEERERTKKLKKQSK